MKNIAKAERPKSAGAMLPPRPLRGSGKNVQTTFRPERREGNSCIPTLNQTFADSRILKISKFRTFRIADRSSRYLTAPRLTGKPVQARRICPHAAGREKATPEHRYLPEHQQLPSWSQESEYLEHRNGWFFS